MTAAMATDRAVGGPSDASGSVGGAGAGRFDDIDPVVLRPHVDTDRAGTYHGLFSAHRTVPI